MSNFPENVYCFVRYVLVQLAISIGSSVLCENIFKQQVRYGIWRNVEQILW